LNRMKKTRFSEAQIVAMLREHEAGKKVADLCREHGVSQPTFYAWRSKYAGLQPSELKELKELRTKYNRLEKMYTESQMDRQVLKEIIEGKL
jgi:putative transposase